MNATSPAAKSSPIITEAISAMDTGGEAVEGVALAEDVHHPVELHLAGRQQLHEAGQGTGFDLGHSDAPLLWFSCMSVGADAHIGPLGT